MHVWCADQLWRDVVCNGEETKAGLRPEKVSPKRCDVGMSLSRQLECIPGRDVVHGVLQIGLNVRPDQMCAPSIVRCQERCGLVRKFADQDVFLCRIVKRLCDLLFVEETNAGKLFVKQQHVPFYEKRGRIPKHVLQTAIDRVTKDGLRADQGNDVPVEQRPHEVPGRFGMPVLEEIELKPIDATAPDGQNTGCVSVHKGSITQAEYVGWNCPDGDGVKTSHPS